MQARIEATEEPTGHILNSIDSAYTRPLPGTGHDISRTSEHQTGIKACGDTAIGLAWPWAAYYTGTVAVIGLHLGE